jgi:hypothetical protein
MMPKGNRRQALLTIYGESRTVTEWAKLAQVDVSKVIKRLTNKWPPRDAVFGKRARVGIAVSGRGIGKSLAGKLYRYWTSPMNIDGNRCEYCGTPATSLDHVTPLAFAENLRSESDASGYEFLVVPSCIECNGLASDILFPSFKEKKEYLAGAIWRRYKKLMQMPTWTEKELSALSGVTKADVESAVRLQRHIAARLEWANA